MRFGWILAALAALFVQTQAYAAVITVPPGTGKYAGQDAVSVYDFSGSIYAEIDFFSPGILNPVLTELVLVDGTPGAALRRGGYRDPILGYFDQDGSYTLPSPLALKTGGQYGFNVWEFLRAYDGAKKAPFTLVSLTVTGTSVSVPEPATWVLTILGIGLTGVVLRRRVRPRRTAF